MSFSMKSQSEGESRDMFSKLSSQRRPTQPFVPSYPLQHPPLLLLIIPLLTITIESLRIPSTCYCGGSTRRPHPLAREPDPVSPARPPRDPQPVAAQSPNPLAPPNLSAPPARPRRSPISPSSAKVVVDVRSPCHLLAKQKAESSQRSLTPRRRTTRSVRLRSILLR